MSERFPPEPWLARIYGVEVDKHRLPVARTRGDVRPGKGVALTGSDGCVEATVQDGSAAQVLDGGDGNTVSLVPTAS